MFPTTRTRRLLGTAALTLALVGGTACGAEGDDDAATSTTTEAGGGASTTSDELGSDLATDDLDTDAIDTDELGSDLSTDLTTDEEPSGDADAYVDAMVASMDDDEGEIFGPGGIECVAEGFVDTIGLDNIQDAGLSPQEFADGDGSDFPPELGVDEDKANELYDVFGDCDIDLVKTFTDLYSSMGELTPEQEACVKDTLTDDKLRTSFVADFLGEDLEDDPLDEVGSCVGFGDDLEADSGAVTVEPRTPTTVG